MKPLRFLPLALLALAACQGQDDPGAAADPAAADDAPMDHAAMGHAMPADTAYSDVAFLDHMTMHHRMAVEMAEVVGDRGESAAVRRMAQAMIAAQTAEIDSMGAWRARWFPNEPAAAPMPPDQTAMMGMDMDMDALRAATGAELDRLFLQDMIPHHAGAITMSAHAQKRTARQEIRDLAQTIIFAQAREIGEMESNLEALPTEPPPPTAQ